MTGQTKEKTPEHFEDLEGRVTALEVALGRRRGATPEFIRLEEAGAMFGLSKGAVQSRLKLEGRTPGGAAIRRLHGCVHLQDWRAYMESRVKRSPTMQARQALSKLRKDGVTI